MVTHLPRTFSDHHPVLIELWKPNANGLERPFRFQTMWLLHLDFYKIVREAWPEGANLKVATTDFIRKAKKWNFEVFGNIFAKKKRVLARLNGTQKALANNPTESLMKSNLLKSTPLFCFKKRSSGLLSLGLMLLPLGTRTHLIFM